MHVVKSLEMVDKVVIQVAIIFNRVPRLTILIVVPEQAAVGVFPPTRGSELLAHVLTDDIMDADARRLAGVLLIEVTRHPVQKLFGPEAPQLRRGGPQPVDDRFRDVLIGREDTQLNQMLLIPLTLGGIG